ncbi:MAG: protein kinase [Polyangiaceae bacterium]
MRDAAHRELEGTPYRLVREIGRGGMGVVVEAIDERTNQRCAVKTIRGAVATDLVDRFRLEWETLAKADSPHVVQVLDAGHDAAGTPFYAMELLTGRTVREDSRQRGPLPLADVLAVGIQMFDGLAAAHALGVVHRDIKPENLFLVGDAKPPLLKLLDFGIAKVTNPTREGPQPLAVPTAEGLMVGTLRWAAPELLLCSGVDARTDHYSAGLVLWSLAVGKIAWPEAKTQEDLILAQMRDALPSIAEVRGVASFARLDALLARLTRKPKEDRLESAREASDALRGILAAECKLVLPPVARSAWPRLDPVAAPQTERAPAARSAAPSPAAGRGPAALVTFPQLTPGQRFEGRYQIDGHIGNGGMGTVYRGKQMFLSREVAIKLIPLVARAVDVDLRQQFANEMQVLARLDHPNIVKIFDGGVTDESMAYIVMELLAGASLRTALVGGVPIPNLKACAVLSQVALGLMALHSVPILHRDIKPENVMVLPNGEVKIVDFGLARVRTKSKYATANPRPTGTLHYMPKEQLLNEPLDESVDVFAFGLMLFECFTGIHPRATESGEFQNARETIVSVVEGKPIVQLRSLRPDLPQELLSLADQCVALDPAKRPKPKEIVAVLAIVTQWATTHRETAPAAAEAADDVSPARSVVVSTEPLPPTPRPGPERFGKRGTVRMLPPAHASEPEESPVPAVTTAPLVVADADTTDRMLPSATTYARSLDRRAVQQASAALTFARTPERPVPAVVAATREPKAARSAAPSRVVRSARALSLVILAITALVAIAVVVELSSPGLLLSARRPRPSASAAATPVAATTVAASAQQTPAAPPGPAATAPAPVVDGSTSSTASARAPALSPAASPPKPSLEAASSTVPASPSTPPPWRPAWQ